MNSSLIRFFVLIAILKLLLHNNYLGEILASPLPAILSLLSIIIALVIHEFAHALAADKLGDPNPRLAGRLSLNPLKHLDPIGTLLIIIAGFGWGKPVAFDPYNLAKPERDGALIALAGPISNFLLWAVCLLLLVLSDNQLLLAFIGKQLWWIKTFLFRLMIINFSLGIFNLMPVYPLDGHHVLRALLSDQPRRYYDYFNQRFGYIFILLILFVPIGNTTIVNACLNPIYQLMLSLTKHIL